MSYVRQRCVADARAAAPKTHGRPSAVRSAQRPRHEGTFPLRLMRALGAESGGGRAFGGWS
jgi:hypothetical protein